ncbi:hypothetical protein H2200_003056 [Cladophialophora chaetospira]|uniref:Xylanolytic transcriptional activator regulatory domain-containing protein n=1 Tax=Cladophialophora chaetospira TaxID=386627 RepID=A0AA39CLX4_9EURO|nr:hypothetical protein H2200_003056 [Cladophialophora chaetospira]
MGRLERRPALKRHTPVPFDFVIVLMEQVILVALHWTQTRHHSELVQYPLPMNRSLKNTTLVNETLGPSSLLSYAHTNSSTLKHVFMLCQEPEDDDLGVQADSGGLMALRPAQFSRPHVRPVALSKQHLGDITSLPDYATSLRLIDNYFDHIGVLFPFLHRETFLSIYTEYRAGACKVRRVSLATVHMVLALALQRGSEPGRSPDQRFEDSWPYYERATVLCDHHIMTDPTLETVQYQLLLTQYLQGTHEAAVTWATHGRAVQSALQIGLHSPQLPQHYNTLESEIRRRTWYTCFILDKYAHLIEVAKSALMISRTLSMAFGRPPMIHDSFMQPALPVCLASLPGVTGATVNRSAEYFASTVSMFSILGNAVEVLYGNNLGYEVPKPVYSLASDVLHTEQKLDEWRTNLPPWLQPGHLSDTEDALTKRFQSITVVRYNYMRALIHRPMMVRLLLQATEHQTRDNTQNHLRGIGQRSLEACVDASKELISCVYAVCKAHAQKELLGTWWCSLYFTFTAALNLFAACLLQIKDGRESEDGLRSPLQLRKSFQQAIRTLEILDEGNSAVYKCIVCLKNLDLALAKLQDASHVSPQEAIANEVSTSLPDSGYADSESLLSLDYADFQEVFDQDLTFLNDMVF